jgi:hypothetical protein
MTQRDFDLVASSILHIRGKAQNDLDWGYSVMGAVVLDQLTERLADDFAAHHPHFNRRAFLEATWVFQSSDDLKNSASDGSTVGCHIVYTAGINRHGDRPKADPRSFDTFAEAKSAMASALNSRADLCAQLDNETGIPMIEAIGAHLSNAKGPEWECSDGAYQFRITSASRWS